MFSISPELKKMAEELYALSNTPFFFYSNITKSRNFKNFIDSTNKEDLAEHLYQHASLATSEKWLCFIAFLSKHGDPNVIERYSSDIWLNDFVRCYKLSVSINSSSFNTSNIVLPSNKITVTPVQESNDGINHTVFELSLNNI